MDVDGVLRPAVSPDGVLPQSAFTSEIVLRRETYPRAFHRAPEWDESGERRTTVVLSGLGASWIRSLLERDVDVAWATTWQQEANSVFGPALGLPPLPVAVDGDRGGARTAAEWKAWQLTDKYPGRPLVWVDDDPLPGARLAGMRAPRDKALTAVCTVNRFEGITHRDIAEVEEWLELASTPEGQAELRRRRRNERERDRRRLERRLWGSVENAARRRRILAHLQQETGADYFLADLVASYVARHPGFDRDGLSEEIEEWGPGLGGLDLDTILAAIEDIR